VSDYFDLLELELRAAVPRAVAPGAPSPAGTPVPAARRRIGLRPGVVPATIGIAATLLVVGLALVMLGHGHTTPSSAGPAPRTPASPGTPPAQPRNPAQTRDAVPSRPAREMLSGLGIAGVKFGRPRAAVVAALDRLLGERPSHPASYRGDCGVDSSITWWDQSSASGRPSLTAYFAHDRLVGYQYGDPGSQGVRRPPARSPVLATTHGLTIGDTLERGRRLYGRAFTISTAQGGTWKVATTSGPIDGYVSGVPRLGNLGALRVVTIDAGNVGCPALSP
jgi:hypothetical protein